MATIKDVRVKARLNVLSVLLNYKGDADQRPGNHGAQRKTIIDAQEVEVPVGEMETRIEHAQLVLEHGYRVDTTVKPPDVTTEDATGITHNAAIFRGHVNPNGQSTAVRFEYSTNIASLTAWATCDETPVTGVTNQSIHKDMPGLSANTRYFYRIRGVSAAGTYYGIVKTFKTSVAP